jgi:hypothetical protein
MVEPSTGSTAYNIGVTRRRFAARPTRDLRLRSRNRMKWRSGTCSAHLAARYARREAIPLGASGPTGWAANRSPGVVRRARIAHHSGKQFRLDGGTRLRLPNGADARISPDKLTGYLLSETHLVGRSKAKFFRSAGFSAEYWKTLERELLNVAAEGDVVSQESSMYGVKYIVDGVIDTPLRGQLGIRTVWIIEVGKTQPSFVTAFPA